MEMSPKTIVVLICFVGKFPWYFEYFLHSCKFNPSVDFIVFNDQDEAISGVPKNVKIIKKDLLEINKIAREKLGFNVNIKNGYKLCDFKPAYGLIFSEFVSDYDFWAHSDIDIIYGDLRNFLDEKMLEAYDYISIRDDYTTGCFSLYKNNSTINNLFKNSKDHQTVLESEFHFCFDECNFKHDLLADGTKTIFDIETAIESFTHVVKTAEQKGAIKAHFDFLLLEGVPGKIKFKDGKILYKNKYEAMLYHLYWLKRYYNPSKIPPILNRYRISKTRIYN
jgi:hypothetical protein